MECCRLAHTIERQIYDLKLYGSGLKPGQRRKVVLKNTHSAIGAKKKTDNSAVL